MDMGTIGWIAFAWFALALVISIALGAFLGQVTATMDETDLATATAKRKGMRFMRIPTTAKSSNKLEVNHSATDFGKHDSKSNLG